MSRLLAVEEPQPVHQRPLPDASREVASIAGYFASVTRLAGQEATLAAVLNSFPDAQCVHLACHGAVDMQNPQDSYLLLADDARLSVGALAAATDGRLRADLVVLSACETAIPGISAVDELIDLPTALLERGAGAAIGSLWVAHDAATALLMARLYWNWHHAGMQLPRAMQDAQRWLRDSTNAGMAEWLRSSAADNAGHRRLAQRRSIAAPGERPFAHPAHWAPFVYMGG